MLERNGERLQLADHLDELLLTGDHPAHVGAVFRIFEHPEIFDRFPGWLADLDFDPPEVDELPVEVRYTTVRYRLPDDVLDGDRHVLIGPTPDGHTAEP